MSIVDSVRPQRMRVHQDISAISPACAGRAHKRCLLTAEQCPCPHHRGEPVDAAPAVEPVTFDCPICFTSFPTVRERATHLSQAHPPLIGTNGR